MYVRELKENMLIVPTVGTRWQFASADAQGEDDDALIANGVAGHLLLHGSKCGIPGYKSLGQDAAVYLYCRDDRWMWGGVFRHHYILVKGLVCILDGYQFKDVQALK
jgi:hypothetical protein